MTQRPLLTERAQNLLRTLIERYIRDGQPVGSRALARDSGMDLSPATIRNVMADLEDMSLVRSPHTSAGRVPTVKGFRLFVDTLLTVSKLKNDEVSRMRDVLDPDMDMQTLLERTSNMLSGITCMAGLVTLPRRERLTLRQVEFLSLSNQRVLVIMVINEREVENRIIHTKRPYTPAELQQAANYLSQAFSGHDLISVRKQLLNEMRDCRDHMDRIMCAAIEMANEAFETKGSKEDYVLAGEVNLLEFAELTDIDRLRQLLDAFKQKRGILYLLDTCLNAEGVQIFIGEESGYKVLDDCSLVTAPYSVEGEIVGVLGVIGPTRMAYARVIPIVDVTARLLGAALKTHA
jgi:heat-inducible transcriptional repressor